MRFKKLLPRRKPKPRPRRQVPAGDVPALLESIDQLTAVDSEPGATKQRLDMLDQFEEAERIAEHVSSLTETVPDQGNDGG